MQECQASCVICRRFTTELHGGRGMNKVQNSVFLPWLIFFPGLKRNRKEKAELKGTAQFLSALLRLIRLRGEYSYVRVVTD
jgi:hypothetical protein